MRGTACCDADVPVLPARRAVVFAMSQARYAKEDVLSPRAAHRDGQAPRRHRPALAA